MTLYRRLQGHARFQPHNIAIKSEAGQLTYHQLMHCVDQCSNWFSAIGINKGDRVSLLALNHPDWFVVLFAAARNGIIVVPLNWRLSVDELQYIVDDSAPVLLLHDALFTETAHALKRDGLTQYLCCDDNFPPPAEPAGTQVTANATDELLIVYTSGTTGKPKGAVLTQRALLCSAQMSQHMLDLAATDRVLNVLPLFHVGGLNIQPLPALLFGATLVSHKRFDPQRAIRSLATDGITLINSVPTLLQAIVDTDEWQSADLSGMRAISIGSTDVPVSLIQTVHKKGLPLIQVYGATEMAPVSIYQRVEHAAIEGSIGRAGLLNDIRLVDDTGVEVSAGQSGEIQVRGENLLTRYWNNPVATEQSMQNGWFASGDVAHQDNDGFFWFDDRLKYVIISGGENIYPAELERLIREVQGVAEVTVVGKPDKRWGEVPVAVVVKGGEVTEQCIFNSCAGIARFKQCKEVLFVDEIPRNALGKVIFGQVRDMVAGGNERMSCISGRKD